jgi:starch-binding outer membrane protein, SusD/RagB family
MKTKKTSIYSFVMAIILCVSLQTEKAYSQSPSEILDSMYHFVLPCTHIYGVAQWIIGETCSDMAEVGGASMVDGLSHQQLSLFNIKEDNITIENYYMWNYYAIGWCNLALYKINKEGVSSTNVQLKAEALALRSLFYFNLVRLFGGVSIYTEKDLASDTLFNSNMVLDYLMLRTAGWNYVHNIFNYDTIKPRNTVSDVYSFIENDLDTALLYLPLKSQLGATEKNHVTQGMAIALLTNINIYQQKWQQALDDAEKLINSGEYALESNFSQVFSIQAEYGNESIFEIDQHPEMDNNWLRGFHNTCQQPRTIWVKKGNSVKPSHWGFGFNIPSKNYVQSFPNNDQRKKQTIIAENDSIVFDIDPDTKDTTWVILDPNCQRSTCNGASLTGYYTRKYFASRLDMRLSGHTPDSLNSSILEHSGGVKNIRVFRYADILLLASEAALHLGNTTKALNYINQVRTRARNSGTTGYPKNLSAITLDSIYNERKWELGGEGYRYFDLIRTRQAYKVLNNLYRDTWSTTITFDTTKNYLYPIPIVSIADSKGIITQNPGYKGWDDIGTMSKIKPVPPIDWVIDTTAQTTSYYYNYIDLSEYNSCSNVDAFDNLSFLNISQNVDDMKMQINGWCSELSTNLSINYPRKNFTDTIIANFNYVRSNITDTIYLNVIFAGKKTGIKPNSIAAKSVKLYPNPADDICTLELSEDIHLPVMMKIYSVDGIEVFSETIKSRINNINLSLLQSGLYILKLGALNQTIKIEKINK